MEIPDIMLLKLGQNRRNFFCSQPTVRSAKPPEENDNTSLILPKLLEGGFLVGDSAGYLAVCDQCRIHDTSAKLKS